MTVKLEPKGFRYEKGDSIKLTPKRSKHFISKGYTEEVLYPGPTVEVVANEILASRTRENIMAQLVGQLSLKLHSLMTDKASGG
jgi:hypothetical protein